MKILKKMKGFLSVTSIALKYKKMEGNNMWRKVTKIAAVMTLVAVVAGTLLVLVDIFIQHIFEGV